MADPALLLTAAAVLTLVGFGWLALAMDTHWEQAHGGVRQPASLPALLRSLAVAALIGSLALCLATDHPTMAVLVWIMLLAGSAVVIAMTLAWRPLWMRVLWPVAAGARAPKG